MINGEPAEMSTARSPQSDAEWTIHALNIHGTFFERWCQRVITETRPWTVRSTDYPVEFPPFTPQRGHGQESALDIRATTVIGDSRLTLVIECKKNNPEFVNWIFIPPAPSTGAQESSLTRFDVKPSGTGPYHGPPIFTPQAVPLDLPMPTVSDARETRATYQQYTKGDKTKTSNAAIWDAARQVAIALQALIYAESQYLGALVDPTSQVLSPYRTHAFLPIIVTTARLFTCGFDPADVNARTGEIPYDQAKLEERPYVIYDFPLPRSLGLPPVDLGRAITSGLWDREARLSMVVVHSSSFPDLLKDVPQWAIGFLR